MAESKTEAGLGWLFCRAGDGGRRGRVSVRANLFIQRFYLFIYLFDLTVYLERRKGPGHLMYAQTREFCETLSSFSEWLFTLICPVRMLSAANNRTLSSTALNNKGNLWAQFLKSVVTQNIMTKNWCLTSPIFFFFGFAFWLLASFLADYCLWDPDTADGHFQDDLLLDSCK